MQDRGASCSMMGSPSSWRGRRRAGVAPRVRITAATPAVAAACPAKIGAPPRRSAGGRLGNVTRSMTLWPTRAIAPRVLTDGGRLAPFGFRRGFMSPPRSRARGGRGRGPSLPVFHSPLAQEAEELDALPQPPAHDDGVAKHSAEHRQHLPGTEVEAAIEILDRAEDLGLSEAWVVQRGDLDPVSVDQLARLDLKPALLLRLAIQLRPRIRGGQRDLDRVRLDLARVAHGLVDRL